MKKETWIDKEIAEKEKVMHLDAHNKNTLRDMLSKEFNYWEREGRDFVNGRDDGEINRGDVREY